MRTIKVPTTEGMKDETVYSVADRAFMPYIFAKDVRKNRIAYINIPCTFDIETTNIRDAERPYAIMYNWQFCIADRVIMGRTWEECVSFFRDLAYHFQLREKRRLVVYVHNFSFEFQFMRRFFTWTEVFCRSIRQPLKALMNGCIEFRCSYALSNMSLQKFCENSEGVTHYKLSGDEYDYGKIRYPHTELTEEELAYCYNDVRGLAECIAARMREDDLAHIPLTSTGYVRRDFRKAYQTNERLREQFERNRLSPELYTACKRALRGGDTHANHNLAGELLHDVQSYDLASSYPAAELYDQYPVSAFFPIKEGTFYSSRIEGFAMLIRIRFFGIVYTGDSGMPYIPLSRCENYTADRINDNGRLLAATAVQMWCTDIDYRIIKAEYAMEGEQFLEAHAAKYGRLPEEHLRTVMNYYRAKTELKGIKEKEYEYMKSKNRLNSSYGMMVTDIAKPEIEYLAGDYSRKAHDLSEALNKYYKSRNSFLSYQQGVWVTANARKRLRDMINVVGADVVYVDTDSIKCRHDHREQFERKNLEIIALAEKYGGYADDRKGVRKYLGIWEYEGTYEEFKTLGAKKYIVKKDGRYESTIAGVSKKAGARFFNEHGIGAFHDGTVITEAGHIVAYYNDDQRHTVELDGHTILTGSNVALIDDVYTIGLTNDYLQLLKDGFDKKMHM